MTIPGAARATVKGKVANNATLPLTVPCRRGEMHGQVPADRDLAVTRGEKTVARRRWIDVQDDI